MKIGTISAGAGVATTINLTYVPQFLYFTVGTVPQSLRVNVSGDGIVADLDANGINMLKNIRLIGVAANTYRLQIANGFIQNKNVVIEITNGDAAAFDLHGYSLRKFGQFYWQNLQNKVFSNSGETLQDFAFLGVQGLVAADDVNVQFRDGHVQKLDQVEIDALLGKTQDGLRSALDNFDQKISQINLTPSADRTIYFIRLARASGIVSPGF